MGRKSAEFWMAIDPTDLSGLERAINDIGRECQTGNKEAVVEGAKYWLQAAYRATPIAEKLTDLIWGREGGRRVPRKISPPRKTPGRGYARSGWIRAFRALGQSGASEWKGPGDATVDIRDWTAKVWMANDVPYIRTLDEGGMLPPIPPHPAGHVGPARYIASRALYTATKRIEKRLLRAAQRSAQRWTAR